jgi:ergothioneine biosynthesis protein EgtB
VNCSELRSFYLKVRRLTEDVCTPLEIEDYVVQPCDDVSPPKWHLGHTSWFFETVLLAKFKPKYNPYHPLFNYIYNSYYESFGTRVARVKRGTLSRPTVKEVYSYRRAIDEQMSELIETVDEPSWPQFSQLLILGLNHEQQHQELLVTDIKYILASNPLQPAYLSSKGNGEAPARGSRATSSSTNANASSLEVTGQRARSTSAFSEFAGGIFEMGHGDEGFAWDNEKPAHRVLLQDYKLSNHLVTNAEFLEFISDGGYENFRLWLSDGWDRLKLESCKCPLYWERKDGQWFTMTLRGLQELMPNEPVCHISYYEADAFARWANRRLPTEAEWEHAARVAKADVLEGNFLEDRNFHPVSPHSAEVEGRQSAAQKDRYGPVQLLGDVWEWTSSAYLPYPGYRPEEEELGEYNGKFMSNQMVLRGGSCATPRSHIRSTYRNFFQCDKRWQFTGIRLASDST